MTPSRAATKIVSSFVMPTLEAYRATGIPHIETVSLAIMSPVYLALYLSMHATLDQFLTALNGAIGRSPDDEPHRVSLTVLAS